MNGWTFVVIESLSRLKIGRKQEKEGTNASDFCFIRIAQTFLENKKSILYEHFLGRLMH